MESGECQQILFVDRKLPLRISAYLCVLCVKGSFQRREPQRYSLAAGFLVELFD